MATPSMHFFDVTYVYDADRYESAAQSVTIATVAESVTTARVPIEIAEGRDEERRVAAQDARQRDHQEVARHNAQHAVPVGQALL